MTAGVALLLTFASVAAARGGGPGVTPGRTGRWLERWNQAITTGAARDRFCDTETGEELGWLVSPYANGFYQGWRATGDEGWINRLIAWTDAWTKRAVTEPDGYPGWPKPGSGSRFEQAHYNDSLLGEAMALKPAILMAAAIRKDPALAKKYGAKADEWIELAERIFEKWDQRGGWRETREGGLWVVPEFGLTAGATAWTDGWSTRTTTGFSNPANKQNAITNWVIALADATGKPVYRDRAEKWWRVMKSRMKTRERTPWLVWNYWDPGGPWDANPDGTLKHWVGVHPNGGYYGIDVDGIVNAFEHHLVFDRRDLDALIATNRDFMWNRTMNGATFGMIDGGKADSRWPDSPGVLWTALIPYDDTLRRIFESTHRPDGWGGLGLTPWYLSLRPGGANCPVLPPHPLKKN